MSRKLMLMFFFVSQLFVQTSSMKANTLMAGDSSAPDDLTTPTKPLMRTERRSNGSFLSLAGQPDDAKRTERRAEHAVGFSADGSVVSVANQDDDVKGSMIRNIHMREAPVEWHLDAAGMYKASPSIDTQLLRGDANGKFGCDSCDCSFIDRFGKQTDCNIERNSRAMVFKWVPPDSTVMEVGARYGTTSCAIAWKQNQSGRVVSFEADHLVWDNLEKNRLSHACNFHTVRGLLGKEDGKIIENHYGTFAANEAAIAKLGVDPATLSVVPHFTLQDIQTAHQFKFDVGLFDCEGCFTSVMMDFPELASQLSLMIVESHNPEEEETVQQLLKNGWVLKDRLSRQRVIARTQ
jgi:FkbM family methyltransferase